MREKGSLRFSIRRNTKKLRPGDLVTVRSFPEISSTLGQSGALGGLPFLPEMLKYCGRTFIVRRRVDKLIQEGSRGGMRRIKNVVLLDGTVCDGKAHGDCQRACFLLWKTAWLKPADGGLESVQGESIGGSGAGPQSGETLLSHGKVCQVTELTVATTPLRLWDPRRYYGDITSHIYTPIDYLSYLLGGIYRNTLRRLIGRVHNKKAPRSNPVASESLNLQQGQLVEVKSAEEIHATLNPSGRNRGLYFMPGMWDYCGRRLRVLYRVDRMMSEKTGELRTLNQTVILEGVTCNGKAHGGCQRGCYVFWKDTWLRRIAEDPQEPPSYSCNPLGHSGRTKRS